LRRGDGERCDGTFVRFVGRQALGYAAADKKKGIVLNTWLVTLV
jgi:hypothetical protein